MANKFLLYLRSFTVPKVTGEETPSILHRDTSVWCYQNFSFTTEDNTLSCCSNCITDTHSSLIWCIIKRRVEIGRALCPDILCKGWIRTGQTGRQWGKREPLKGYREEDKHWNKYTEPALNVKHIFCYNVHR